MKKGYLHTGKRKNNSLRNVLKNIRLECSELLFNKSGHLILVTKRFEEFHKLILDTHSGEYHVCDEMSVLNKQYDAFICGSDQIWNPNITDLDDSFFCVLLMSLLNGLHMLRA